MVEGYKPQDFSFFHRGGKISATRDQILEMEKEIGCKRYCPHEVAVSSALHSGGPASSDIIIKEGESLYDYLISMIDNNKI